ncbi:MAG TPA: HepT-like ribonuclease domain-containing protein [Albitalea sp.]
MRRDPRAYLWDVREASRRITEFVEGIGLEEFCDDALVRSAVERQFEIVGEALSQLAKVDPVLASRVPEHRRIIAFRNVLIHGYAALDHPLVWRVIQEDLPTLGAAVDALLTALGSAAHD